MLHELWKESIVLRPGSETSQQFLEMEDSLPGGPGGSPPPGGDPWWPGPPPSGGDPLPPNANPRQSHQNGGTNSGGQNFGGGNNLVNPNLETWVGTPQMEEVFLIPQIRPTTGGSVE